MNDDVRFSLGSDQIWVRNHLLFPNFFADTLSAMGITNKEYETNPEYALMVDNNIMCSIMSIEDGNK